MTFRRLTRELSKVEHAEQSLHNDRLETESSPISTTLKSSDEAKGTAVERL